MYQFKTEVNIISKYLNKTPRNKLQLWCVPCHQSELFPLLAEVPETKTEIVSTKLSELPQTTTYHIITYKQLLGIAHYIRPESGNCIGPKSGTD